MVSNRLRNLFGQSAYDASTAGKNTHKNIKLLKTILLLFSANHLYEMICVSFPIR